MNKNTNAHPIPAWMKQNEIYTPVNDREGFITKSLLTVMSVLSSFRMNGVDNASLFSLFGSHSVPEPSAPIKFLAAVLMILLASCSQNMFFTYCLIAILLVHMCALRDKQLLKVFAASVTAAVFSALILLPAIFLGSPHTMLTVSVKVFLSVGLLGLMAVTTPWNKITEGLRFYRIPDLMIFTFDITLKYIVILGDICIAMLTALKLRSVGKNRTKKNALSGIIGIAFLRSRNMAEEMCDAMRCRGFEGEYRKGNKALLKKTDVLFICFLIIILVFYILL